MFKTAQLRPPVVTDEIMNLHERVQRLELLGFPDLAERLRVLLKIKIAEANPEWKAA